MQAAKGLKCAPYAQVAKRDCTQQSEIEISEIVMRIIDLNIWLSTKMRHLSGRQIA